MSNPLRVINKKYKNFKPFSVEGFYILISLVGVGSLVSKYFNISTTLIGAGMILLGIALWIDSYFMEKK